MCIYIHHKSPERTNALQKSYVGLWFCHLDIMNAMVFLMMPLASHDAVASATVSND